MTYRFDSAMARFYNIFNRLESRIRKDIGVEADIALTALIEEAKNISVGNKAKMAELKAKNESLLEGGNLQEVNEGSYEMLENSRGIEKEARAIAKELKQGLRKLNTKLSEIAGEIRKNNIDRRELTLSIKNYNSSIGSSRELKITLMQNHIEKIQERLKRCDNIDVCDIVERHAEGREGLIDTTKKAIENRNREEAARLLREVRGIVVGDIELLESAENIGLIADVLELERSLLNHIDSALISI